MCKEISLNVIVLVEFQVCPMYLIIALPKGGQMGIKNLIN